MEYVEGPTLARLVHDRGKRNAPLDLGQVVRLGVGVAEALEVMHAKGLVYRDLNPENVVVVANGEPRLLDLELASELGATSALFAAGSPGYASPQQLEGTPAAVTDDVYALGALIAFIATGREPSEGLRLDGVDRGLAVGHREMLRSRAGGPSGQSMTDVDAALSGIEAATA